MALRGLYQWETENDTKNVSRSVHEPLSISYSDVVEKVQKAPQVGPWYAA